MEDGVLGDRGTLCSRVSLLFFMWFVLRARWGAPRGQGYPTLKVRCPQGLGLSCVDISPCRTKWQGWPTKQKARNFSKDLTWLRTTLVNYFAAISCRKAQNTRRKIKRRSDQNSKWKVVKTEMESKRSPVKKKPRRLACVQMKLRPRKS